MEGNVVKTGPGAAPSQGGPAVGFCVDGPGGEVSMASFTEQSAVGHHPHCIQFVSGHGRGGWRQIGVAIPKPLRQSSGTVHIGTHVAVPAPEYGRTPIGQSPGFPRRSTGREPTFARPTTYGGRHDEGGTSTGRIGGARLTSGTGEYISLLLLNC